MGTSRTEGSSMKAWNAPMALEPPPMQATTASGGASTDRESFEAFLAARGYTVAPFTIEHDDYVYACVYDKLALSARQDLQAKVVAEYDDHLRQAVGTFERIERTDDGIAVVHFRAGDGRMRQGQPQGHAASVRCRCVIGADGAKSEVAQQNVPGADRGKFVFAYHEILRAPVDRPGYDGTRCDVVYNGEYSPDFYGWVFPHGDTMSVGTGSADKGFSLRTATEALRRVSGLGDTETLRREGAPIPLKPLPRWDNGRDVVLAGDAAGVVAPASGEGIYYAMYGGKLAAEASLAYLASGQPRDLQLARKRFMKAHGKVFWVLGVMQHFWYSSDKRRERFVSICRDRDVQQLTFESYMNKELTRKKPMAHVRIFFKDVAHLLGLARV